MIQRKKYIMSMTFIMMIHLSKKLFRSNQNEFTYHSVSLDNSKIWSNYQAYDLKQSIGEININITMKTKYYE